LRSASRTFAPEPNAETRCYVQGTFGSARDIGTDNRSTLVAMDVTGVTVDPRSLVLAPGL